MEGMRGPGKLQAPSFTSDNTKSDGRRSIAAGELKKETSILFIQSKLSGCYELSQHSKSWLIHLHSNLLVFFIFCHFTLLHLLLRTSNLSESGSGSNSKL